MLYNDRKLTKFNSFMGFHYAYGEKLERFIIMNMVVQPNFQHGLMI